MLIRIFSNNTQKDILLPGNENSFSIGSSKDDSFSLPNTSLKKKHVVLSREKIGWTITCNGDVFSRGQTVKKENVHLSAIYMLGVEEKISLLLLDDQNMEHQCMSVNRQNEVLIGRGQENDITIRSGLVSKEHAEIKKIGDAWYLRDLGSTNGTYLNGTSVQDMQKLKPTDIVAIGDISILFGGSTIEISAAPGEAQLSVRKTETALSENVLFDRSPRLKLEMPTGIVEIEAPPAVASKPELNLPSLLLPALGTIGIAIAATAISGSLRMLLYTLPMTLIGIIVSGINYRKQKRGYTEQNQLRLGKYTEHLEKIVGILKRKQQEQMSALEASDPDVGVCFDLVESVDRKIWDRKPADRDFMSVRLGTGTVPSSFEIRIPKETISLENDELRQRPEKIYKKYHLLEHAPITCSILTNQVCGIVGVKNDTYRLVKNMIAQIATHHCYTEVKMIVVYDAEDQADFGWVEKLPHALNDDRSGKLIATNRNAAEKLFGLAADALKSRKLELEEEGNFGAMPIPYYLFVVAQPLFLGRNEPITEYLFRNRECNAGLLLVVESITQLPKECNLIVEVNNQSGKIYHRENASACQEFVVDAAASEDFSRFSDNLGHIICNEGSSKELIPQKYSFFDMMKIKSVSEYDLGQVWTDSDATKSLAAPLGIGNGKEIFLDVHEKAHGPHGLVAGTTGSGKSELLQSYILAMAMNYHPHEVAFVIIDFKGGGMANQFEKLPHLVGSITNMEGNAINRSLASINAELMKRQKLFAEANVNNIDKYMEKYKGGDVAAPLPHLIIIVDEFAELKAEQPEFMKELISAARIGRSLGIHLILATQKPAGQVNEQIWSNSRFKICLKVATREDSNEVIKSAAAFKIKEPGRAYLQVGNNEVFELFQSGYSGEMSVGFGVPKTQLQEVVDYIAGYCEKNGIRKLPEICLPPLPEILPYRSTAGITVSPCISACVGRYDLPSSQFQGDITLNLSEENVVVVGSAQSGKTNLLQTILRSLFNRYTSDQVNIYVIDFASMQLKSFEDSAYVGGVVLSSEDEKISNLFKMLLAEITSRKEIFVHKGVGSHKSYCDAGFTDLPQIILMIDNLTALRELYPETDDSLLLLCREGISVGISIVFTNSQTTGIGYKFLMNFSKKIALHCNDSGEYTAFFDHSCKLTANIPGRAILEMNHQIVEGQIYLPFAGEREIDRANAIREFVASSNSSNRGLPAKRIPVVPQIITVEGLEQIGLSAQAENYHIPLGLDYDTMELLQLDMLKQGVLAISGEEHSGKTNLTLHIISAIQHRIFDNFSSVYIADETGGLDSAAEFGCVEQYTRKYSEARAMIETVYAELQNRHIMCEENDAEDLPLLMLILSGQDLLSSVLSDGKISDKLLAIAKDSRKYKTFVLLSDLENAAINYTSASILKHVKEYNSLIALNNIGEIRLLDIPGKLLKKFEKDIRPGDGFSFMGGKVRKVHFILHQPE